MLTLIKSSTILLFIDSTIENYQTLIDGVIPETEVIVLHPAEDGIKQIATTLKGRSDVASVHIVSHGEPGCLLLGNSRLSLDNLKDYAQDLKNWFSSSLFFYGCSVAAGEVGIAFVRQLQQLTGANIAASTTPTGSKELGGDWNLDVTIRARGWATQTSGLDKSKHFWHDENLATDLPSNRQDNTAGADTADWTALGPSAEVPFEFSPSLGLAIVVGIVSINRLWRKLKYKSDLG